MPIIDNFNRWSLLGWRWVWFGVDGLFVWLGRVWCRRADWWVLLLRWWYFFGLGFFGEWLLFVWFLYKKWRFCVKFAIDLQIHSKSLPQSVVKLLVLKRQTQFWQNQPNSILLQWRVFMPPMVLPSDCTIQIAKPILVLAVLCCVCDWSYSLNLKSFL